MIFCSVWFTEKILSDQGRNFESSLIAELCKITQVKNEEQLFIGQRGMVLVRDLIQL